MYKNINRMKYRLLTFIAGFLLFIFQSCQPLTSIKIETIVPADIDFPGNFNKIVFINLATDINYDDKMDTLLYNIITQEMSLGFMDAIQQSVGVDSSNFLYVKGYPEKEKFYKLDTVSWQYMKKISGQSDADIFIVLDSLNLSMESELIKESYSYPVEYYKYRQLAVNISWSVFDMVDKKRLDKYYYNDTLLWDARGYSKVEIDKKMQSVERSIRETSYFAAVDYAKRIFPEWQSETRYYFHLGNKDFVKADQFVKNENWEEASKIWKNYTNNIDKEIASRACYNMAFVSEIEGKLELAIEWAEKSNKIKNKSRTRYYISWLKIRQKDLKKLQKQIY